MGFVIRFTGDVKRIPTAGDDIAMAKGLGFELETAGSTSFESLVRVAFSAHMARAGCKWRDLKVSIFSDESNEIGVRVVMLGGPERGSTHIFRDAIGQMSPFMRVHDEIVIDDDATADMCGAP